MSDTILVQSHPSGQATPLPLDCPALTEADVINVAEFLTGETYTIARVKLAGTYRDICRPQDPEARGRRFLLVEDANPATRLARWGVHLGEPDMVLTRAFTIIARALSAGLLQRGVEVILDAPTVTEHEAALAWGLAS